MKKLFIALVVALSFSAVCFGESIDEFKGTPIRMDFPPNSAEAITPSDTIDIPHVSRVIFIGTSGILTVDMAGRKSLGDGGTVTYNAIAAGFHEMRVTRIYNSTTAGNIISLW